MTMTADPPAAATYSGPIPTRHPRTPTTPGSALTERDRQVLDLASYGLTDAEIGLRLYLTRNTVKTHMRAVLVRLDARGRTHAVRRGFELGILTTQETP